MATPAKKLTPTDESRGIQNAVSRFKRQREGQTLQSQLLAESEGGRIRGEAVNDVAYAANDPEYSGGRRSGRQSRIQDEAAAVERELSVLAEREGIEYQKGDEGLILKNTPTHPDFPMIIFSIALLKDIVDGLEVTGIGIVVTTVFSFILALVLFLWNLGKLSGGWWKKKLIKKLWIKYALAMAVEFIPIGKIIPANTIFILMAHYDETKLVRILNGALERVRRGGVPL